MSSEMTVDFPGGKKVTAHYDGFDIATDQGVDSGGEGTAPEPFDLFLASLATCAGYYVLKFCEGRCISTDGVTLHQSWERNEDKKLVRITIRIQVPPDFPGQVPQGPRPRRQHLLGEEDARRSTGDHDRNGRDLNSQL